MRRAPVCPLAKHEPAAGEKFQDVVAGLENLALERLAAAQPSRTRSSVSLGIRTAVSSAAR